MTKYTATLTYAQLQDLGNYLAERVFVPGDADALLCDHTHKHTRQWCNEHRLDPDEIVDWLELNGGHCDCEVGFNVVTQSPYTLKGYGRD